MTDAPAKELPTVTRRGEATHVVAKTLCQFYHAGMPCACLKKETQCLAVSFFRHEAVAITAALIKEGYIDGQST